MIWYSVNNEIKHEKGPNDNMIGYPQKCAAYIYYMICEHTH